tara:strand:+ start:162 stop:677 length:516 start_codon:yes stop_codon:yes gene_type:complete
MNKITVFALPLLVMTSCVSERSNQAAVNVSRPAEPKTELQICVNKVSKAILSREQKISSIARKWTYGGGAKYGSGGIGRASIEADIWADAEMSKLADWKYRQLERCNSMAARATSSPRNIPLPLHEIGKSQNVSNSAETETSSPMEIDTSCVQDGGTQMCYNRQSQRYGNN